jgi:hypothetical protein
MCCSHLPCIFKARRVLSLIFFQRPSSAARPPKTHGPASRRPRPSAESAPLSQPLYCLSSSHSSPAQAHLHGRTTGRCPAQLIVERKEEEKKSTRPTSPPYPAPQLISPPSPPPSPDPLACDIQLASVAVSAARRDSASFHPGRAHLYGDRHRLALGRPLQGALGIATEECPGFRAPAAGEPPPGSPPSRWAPEGASAVVS